MTQSDEAKNLIPHLQERLGRVRPGRWVCEEGVNDETVSARVLDEIEAHFRSAGYETARKTPFVTACPEDTDGILFVRRSPVAGG